MTSSSVVSPNIETKEVKDKPNYFLKFLRVLLYFLATTVVITVLAVIIGYSIYLKVPNLTSPVSILILGKGGEGHTAPNLTDTIMVANLNNESGKINILSLPRDIWITEIRAKINTAYHYGGFEMAKNSVQSVTGLPINYVVVVDFSLFKDFIDSMGGINVEVENSFIDEKYPIAGLENDLCNGDRTYSCRYEVITFNKGNQKMDGELALKFVRSRNAVGDEGTDLAREKRQQKVVEAIKQKALSSEVLLSPKTLKGLYTVFVTHIETDLDIKTMETLIKFAIESGFNTNFLSIPEEFLIISQNNIKYDRQYVFLPTSGSWKEFQMWLQESI